MEINRVAQRIRAFRKLKGLTQIELAQRIGVSIGILGAVERGVRAPDEQLLDRIAEELDIEVSELIHYESK